jgi:hypothetical protein
VSSGNHAGKVGFNMSGKPREAPACPHDPATEPRGPGERLAGLCVACGRGTAHRGADGMPRHVFARVRPVACCPVPGCGAPLDGGPVLYRCPACSRQVWAADLVAEREPAGARTGELVTS